MDLGVLELMPGGLGSGSAARSNGFCRIAADASAAARRTTSGSCRARRSAARRRHGSSCGAGSRSRGRCTTRRDEQP